MVNSLAGGLRARTMLAEAGKVCGVFTSIGPYYEVKRQKYDEARREEVLT